VRQLEESIVLNCHYDDVFDIEPFTINLIKAGKNTLQKCGISSGEASIYITGDEYLKILNEKYRGIDEVTDVLSFSNDHEGEYYGAEEDNRVGLSHLEFITPDGLSKQIGEVVISFPQAERQALEHNLELQEELKFLVIHGFLHLLGYDHIGVDDRNEMESLEKEIMAG
jgi:probable rRNA maturation factor